MKKVFLLIIFALLMIAPLSTFAADAVTTQYLVNSTKVASVIFTNISDGTGESAVNKINISDIAHSPTSIEITRIQYSLRGMSVNILEDATSDVVLLPLGSSGNASSGTIDFNGYPLKVTGATGSTGDILFSTVNANNSDSYTIIIDFKKKYN